MRHGCPFGLARAKARKIPRVFAELVAGAGATDAADHVCREDEEAELDGDGEY